MLCTSEDMSEIIFPEDAGLASPSIVFASWLGVSFATLFRDLKKIS